MTMRTHATTVTFNKRFAFPDSATTHRPGTFRVETDEESIEGLSFVAYRRIATRIHIGRPGSIEVHTIDPEVLDWLLEQDRDGAGDEYEQRNPMGAR